MKKFFTLFLLVMMCAIASNAGINNLFTVGNNNDFPEYKEKLRSYSILNLDRNQLAKIVQTRNSHLDMTLPNGVKVNLNATKVLSDAFVARTSEGNIVPYTPGAYYRGSVDGIQKSLAAFSFFNDRVMAVFSDQTGNWVLGPVSKSQPGNTYILYNDKDIIGSHNFECHNDDGILNLDRGRSALRQAQNGNQQQGGVCVNIYFEFDFDMYVDNGSSVANTNNYFTGLFNVIATLYSNELVTVVIGSTSTWTAPDPYSDATSLDALNDFTNALAGNFNGETLAHLVSTTSSNLGGIAYIDALCDPTFATGYSNIYNTFNAFPTYSWDAEVVTHELGHNLGSNHTHWCGWPGGAIDDCYTTEGGCASGPTPVNGGTIMSYCHLTATGINFNNGFGPFPGQAIRDGVAAAGCLPSCTSGSGLDCTGAVALACSTNYSSTTVGGNSNVDLYNCIAWDESGPERVHTITTSTVGDITATLTGLSVDLDVFILSACDENACVAAGDNVATYASAPAGTYYIIVDGFTGASGSYILNVQGNCNTAVNDNPCGAITLTVNATCSYTACNNTLSTGTTGVSVPSCGIYNGLDVWYKFVAPASGNVIINARAGTLLDGVMAVYSGTCSGTLTEIACNDDSLTGGTNLSPYLSLTGLTNGTTYYIRYFDYNGDDVGTFDLCLYTSASCTAPSDPSTTYGSATCPGTAVTGSPSLTWSATGPKYFAYVYKYPYGSGNIVWSTANCITTTSVTPAFTPTAGMVYQYRVAANGGDCTNAACNSAANNPKYFYAAPSISPSTAQSICAGGTKLFTTGAVTVTAPGAVAYQWYRNAAVITGATNTTYSATLAGTYYVRVTLTGATGCATTTIQSASVALTVNTTTVNATAGSSAVCQFVNVSLSASAGTGATYQWTGPNLVSSSGANVSANPATAGTATYIVAATLNGCVGYDTITVTVNSSPTVNVTAGSSTICEGQTVSLNATGANNYAWVGSGLSSTTGASVTATLSLAGSYIFNVTGESNGCFSQPAGVTVNVNALVTPSVSITFTGCPDSSLIFTASSSNGGTAPVYNWFVNNVQQSGANSVFTLNPAHNGDQVYAVLNSNEACVTSSTATSAVESISCINTAINEPGLHGSLSIYPNPTSEQFFIHVKMTDAMVRTIQLTDADGKLVQEFSFNGKQEIQLNVPTSKLSNGIYYLQLMFDDGKVISQKVSVKH